MPTSLRAILRMAAEKGKSVTIFNIDMIFYAAIRHAGPGQATTHEKFTNIDDMTAWLAEKVNE